MRITTKMIAGASAFALVAGIAVANTASAQVTESWFRHFLAKQYFMLAQGEDQDQLDIVDSNYLRSAGVGVLNGHRIYPHPLEDVRIVSSRPGELQSARNFLVQVQRNGAAVKAPVPFAKALSAFDCWVEQQQSEPNAAHNLQQCKLMYLRNAAKLQHLAGTMRSTENLRTLHRVYFAWDRSDLGPDARSKLDSARSMLTDVRNGKLIISGFADASGSRAYNMNLSRKRAQNVANYLNIPQDRFEVRVKAYGEDRLHVPTRDGVRKAANRVVDISVHADKVVK